MNLDNISTPEPIAFDDYDYYTYTDLDYDDSLPPFKMVSESSDLSPCRYKKKMNILFPSQEDDDSEYSDDYYERIAESEKKQYGSLDIISLNVANNKLDFTSQLYFGSLTMVGLFILFRYFKK